MQHKNYTFSEYKLHMVREREIRFLSEYKIENAFAGSKLIRKLIRETGQTDRECFVVVMLNTLNVPLGANLVAIGTIDSCPVQPREVIKAAISMPCKGLIMGHNHPSGNTSSSLDDKLITLMIMASAKLFDIKILDHIIVDMDSDAFTSFAEEKIFDEIKEKVRKIMSPISKL